MRVRVKLSVHACASVCARFSGSACECEKELKWNKARLNPLWSKILILVFDEIWIRSFGSNFIPDICFKIRNGSEIRKNYGREYENKLVGPSLPMNHWLWWAHHAYSTTCMRLSVLLILVLLQLSQLKMGKCVMLIPELSIKSNSHKASFTPSSTRTQIHQHASSFGFDGIRSEITPYTIFNHTGQNFEGGY